MSGSADTSEGGEPVHGDVRLCRNTSRGNNAELPGVKGWGMRKR